MLKNLKGFWFVYGLFGAIGLAWLLPGWGAPGGWLQASFTTKLGVFVIFFLQGLSLPTEDLARGLKLWRLHCFIQTFIFLGGPLVAALLSWPLRESMGEVLWLGLMFLAVLPCTISTSVVFSTQAGGNVAAALFNTSLANVAGIFIVPTVMVWLASAEGGDIPLLPLLGKVLMLLFLPLVLGQLARFLIAPLRIWAFANRKRFSTVNSSIVLFIVYCSFCGSFQSRFWVDVPVPAMLWAVVVTLVLLLVLRGLLYAMLRTAKVSYAEAATAFFCGGQKTLAAGVPLAQGIFAAGGYDLGVILLPLMCYAPLQFTLDGVIVGLLQQKHAASTTG